MTGKKFVPAAFRDTQRLPAVQAKKTSQLSRLNLAIPTDDRRRWEMAAEKMHMRTLTAMLIQVMGRECDRLGIK